MWFLLNNIPNGSRRDITAVIGQFNARSSCRCGTVDSALDLFAPSVVAMSRNDDGTYRTHMAPLLYHYVFVKGAYADVKRLCAEPNGLSFVLDRSGATSRPVTVSDDEIHAFGIIARALAGRLPVILASQVDIADGDQVEVITGPFKGLGGIFHPRKGAKTGTITVTSGAGLTAVVTEMHVSQLRVVKFADMSKRPYDIIDAFTPRLLGALRPYGTGGDLDADTIAPLVCFTRRLDGTSIDNPKLDAKLQLHLLGAWTILGDNVRATRSRLRYEARVGCMTNPQLQALACLILGIIDREPSKLQQMHHLLEPLKNTVVNNMLQTEFEFWNDHVYNTLLG